MLVSQHPLPRLALARVSAPARWSDPTDLEAFLGHVAQRSAGQHLVLVLDVRLSTSLEAALARQIAGTLRRFGDSLQLVVFTQRGSELLPLQMDQMARRLPAGVGVAEKDRAATLARLGTLLPPSELRAVEGFLRQGDVEQRRTTPRPAREPMNSDVVRRTPIVEERVLHARELQRDEAAPTSAAFRSAPTAPAMGAVQPGSDDERGRAMRESGVVVSAGADEAPGSAPGQRRRYRMP